MEHTIQPAPAPRALGLFYLTTDDMGRFVVPEMPEGTLRVSGDDGEIVWTMASPTGDKVEAGKTTLVELKSSPGVRVRGVVVNKGTGKPVRGAQVGPYGGKAGESDASGRFSFFARAGRALIMLGPPEGYSGLLYGVPDVTIPKDVAEFEIPPIEIAAAGQVAGIARDNRGRSLPKVTVAASWQVNEGPNRQGRRDSSVTTDGQGAFSVEGVPLAAAVTLTASATGLGRTPQPAIAHAGESVVLTLDPSGLVPLKGRVLDAGGNPMAGARVHLRGRERYESGQIKNESPVEFAGVFILRADNLGRFETPRGLDPDREYSAIAEADGSGPGQTEWILAGSRSSFDDLILDPEGIGKRFTVEFRVRDVRDGAVRPISLALAWSSFPGCPERPEKVGADERGRFRIEGLPATGALVFVEAEGFRFEGFAATPSHPTVGLTLTRGGERSLPMETLPPPMPRADELAQAGLVIDPLSERVMKERPDDVSAGYATLSVLARIAPARVLEAIAARPFKEGWYNDQLRAEVALALMANNLDEASAVAESIELAYVRSSAFVRLADRLPLADRKGKLQLLDRTLLASRSVPEPGYKLVGIAEIAEHWIDLGEIDRGSKLLREFEPTALELPKQGWDAYARGRFAEELSQVAPDAASKLIEGLDETPDSIPDRHRINVAQELASRDPAAAGRLLDGLKQPSSIIRRGAGVAHAMAPKDLARARRIVNRMTEFPKEFGQWPFNHAHALGMMAHALAGVNKDQATLLLDEAFDELARLRTRESKRTGACRTPPSWRPRCSRSPSESTRHWCRGISGGPPPSADRRRPEAGPGRRVTQSWRCTSPATTPRSRGSSSSRWSRWAWRTSVPTLLHLAGDGRDRPRPGGGAARDDPRGS